MKRFPLWPALAILRIASRIPLRAVGAILGLALAAGGAARSFSESPAKAIPSIAHRAAPSGFSLEGCVAMFWSRDAGRIVTAEEVYSLAASPVERGAGSRLEELDASLTKLGFHSKLDRSPDLQSAMSGLVRRLEEGSPVVIPWRSGGAAKTEPCVLICGHDDGVFTLHDPGAADGENRKVAAEQLLARWARPVGLALGRRAPPPRPAVAGAVNARHSRYAYAAHIGRLQERIPRVLPDREFTILAEPPFVVICDQNEKVTRRWSEGTVRWAVARMKALYFQRDPPQILDIWLFTGKESYESGAEALFRRKPTTPYGYYSPSHAALVMNIQTGGGTLVHEILHPFMAANFTECPSWFNEGLASLYEQCGERDGKIWGATNWRLAGLQRSIAADRNPTLEAMCGTTRDEFYGDGTGLHYAQARYLCYYLQERGLLTTFYHQFNAAAKTDPSGLQTLQKVLDTTDMAAFQEQWEAYVLKLKFQ